MAKAIRREELREKIARGDDFVLLETLAPRSFERGHLPGARNLPVDRIRTGAAALIPRLDSEIVVYCASFQCDASTKAVTLLERLGYTKVFDYHGGKADWKEAGLPMETGPAA
jgi:rhodanese-related sulfurtransferase